MVGLNILWFVLILMFLVLVHEAGHMVVAKWCGMRVERFSIFFGRPIWSFRRGETEYGIGWLPLGGYVKISGMTRGEEIPPEVEPRAYYNMPAWRKIVTILAGPRSTSSWRSSIFAAIFWIGVPTARVTDTVGAVSQGQAAAQAGLQPGDRFVAIDDVKVNGDPERLRQQLLAGEPRRRRRADPGAGRPHDQAHRRAAAAERRGRPAHGPRLHLRGGGGADPAVRVHRRAAGGPRLHLLRRQGERRGASATSSPARRPASRCRAWSGVGAVFNEVSDEGLITLLRFVGVISLALGIFNLLPILPLDGGHILFALLEKAKGSPLSRTTYERASFIGFALVLVVFVFALQNDIGRITGEGFQLNR